MIIIIIIIHSFRIALFSALEQTHCAHVACDSERVPVAAHFRARVNVLGSGVMVALFSC